MNIDPGVATAVASAFTTIFTVLVGIRVSHTKISMKLENNGERLDTLEKKLFGNGQKGLNERVIELETKLDERTGE